MEAGPKFNEHISFPMTGHNIYGVVGEYMDITFPEVIFIDEDLNNAKKEAVSYTHLTLPTTPYV